MQESSELDLIVHLEQYISVEKLENEIKFNCISEIQSRLLRKKITFLFLFQQLQDYFVSENDKKRGRASSLIYEVLRKIPDKRNLFNEEQLAALVTFFTSKLGDHATVNDASGALNIILNNLQYCGEAAKERILLIVMETI